ncbi:hypothetical protein GQ53DRAFT_740516 [Thozetella sp. PMI_491]|nr:hypothetical protein GQ53DRAFT_740516 [Thozetella sp. PMI_491]
MLKQIHAIEQHGGPSKDQVQEFEQWLAGYLGVDITPPATGNAPPATDGTAPAADDTPQDSSDAPSTEDTTTPTTEDSPSLPGLTASLAAIGLPSAPTED